MRHIRLDMLKQISFGNKEYLQQLLEGAREEIMHRSQWWNERTQELHQEEVFREMHKLKTTFSMLQASEFILESQAVLDIMEGWPSAQLENKLDELFLKKDILIEEIDLHIAEL